MLGSRLSIFQQKNGKVNINSHQIKKILERKSFKEKEKQGKPEDTDAMGKKMMGKNYTEKRDGDLKGFIGITEKAFDPTETTPLFEGLTENDMKFKSETKKEFTDKPQYHRRTGSLDVAEKGDSP